MESIRDNNVPRVRINPFEQHDDDQFKKNRISTDQILTYLCYKLVVTFQIQDDSGDMQGISQQSISKIARNVAEALAKKAHLFINMPTTLEAQQETMRGFRSICDFPTVIGAIDCTHIKIRRVGGDMSEAYVNRKGYYSINVQVVCDSKLKIRDIVARWRGSAHDSRIFNESTLKERFERGEFHGRLLGDSGYACTPYLFTPVLNPSNDREESYNRAHIRTRNTIERCFGLWKQRFRCLLRGMFMKLSTAKTTIVALAVLHSIAIDMNEDLDIIRYDRQSSRSQTQRPTVRGAVIRQQFINQHFN
ncbi:putative nuclease HARBI1 [Helicoverpa zea]|uniref:putative nuclease HARBI1 n=1 Tax=Helicoverpa zea TaxID=7113 RepID=UPI001F597524|nr:putative nuclease HARBI1 [Helicoverpa zea]